MKSPDRFLRKSYAMQRMALALRRAIECKAGKDKERAARWAAAWGLLCGIQTQGVKLRHADVGEDLELARSRSTDEITFSPMAVGPIMTDLLDAPSTKPPVPATASGQDGVPFVSGIFDPTSQP